MNEVVSLDTLLSHLPNYLCPTDGPTDKSSYRFAIDHFALLIEWAFKFTATNDPNIQHITLNLDREPENL